ncbi:hypothetical protein FRC11_005163, partial [Ceratobasidium sp. 423]
MYSLSITTHPYSVFREGVNLFLGSGVPHLLSELSLRQTGIRDSPVKESDCTFKHNFPESSFLTSSLTESLSTLRLSGVYSYWDPSRARNLVELELNNLAFEDDSALTACLQSISSASQLRNLKLIAVRIDLSPATETPPPDTQGPRTISFPRLQFLTLNGIFLNDLQTIFDSIYRGPHELILYLTETNFMTRDFEDAEINGPDVKGLAKVLNLAHVDSLLVNGDCGEILLHGPRLFYLLHHMPELKTLKITNRRMTGDVWSALLRPNILNPKSKNLPFPQLQNLHLTGVEIYEEEELKKVVRSHQIQLLELGARKYSHPPDPYEESEAELQELSDGLL